MSFQNLVQAAQQYFSTLQIKYKDQSPLMKVLGTIMFFNKKFMTSYTTTLGSTVYFPNEAYTRLRPVSAAVVLLHELVHIKDAKKISPLLFGFLYLCPQILALLCLPLFVISWKVALPLFLLFACPIPAYFRMLFEKRAYMSSLYSLKALGQRLNFDPNLPSQSAYYAAQFTNSYYYFMWPFGIKSVLDQAVTKIEAGRRPFEDPVFDIIDDLITKV